MRRLKFETPPRKNFIGNVVACTSDIVFPVTPKTSADTGKTIDGLFVQREINVK